MPSLEAAQVAWSVLRGEGGAEMDDATRMCASCHRALLAGVVWSSYALCVSASAVLDGTPDVMTARWIEWRSASNWALGYRSCTRSYGGT